MESENQEYIEKLPESTMSQDFFKDLPFEIIVNILSRLPAKTTMRCKCVSKPWLDLLMTPEFVKSHISNSVPGLAVFKGGIESKPLKIVEFVDEDELGLNCHERRWDIVLKMDFPFHEPLHSSTNGLLFLCKRGSCHRGDLFLCNPITCEYIKLPSPRQHYSQPMLQLDTFGFGVSRMSCQYKVVRMFLDVKLPLCLCELDRFECQVYTVGSGSWRRIASAKRLFYLNSGGVFLNGNLHFLARQLFNSYQVSCLDLETEHFSTFSPPPLNDVPHRCRNLSVLRDCLCVCENSGDELTCGYEIDIWLMKEYGDEKSWTKAFVICKVNSEDFLGSIIPLKVFKDGSILMELGSSTLLYYSSKTKAIRHVNLSGLRGGIISSSAAIYAPSFLPLKTFAMEKDKFALMYMRSKQKNRPEPNFLNECGNFESLL